jgi:hypothetical protein
MSAVAKALAEIKVEIKAIEQARASLHSEDPQIQRVAVRDLALSGMAASKKAEEIIDQILGIKKKVQKYLKQVREVDVIS